MAKSKQTGQAPATAKRPKPPQSRQGGKQLAAPPMIPAVLQTPEFAAAWADWERCHAEHGIAWTAENTVRQLELLARLGPEEAVADIRQTLAEQVPAPTSTPTVGVPPVEYATPTAEHLVEPATATDAVSTLPNKIMVNEVMVNEVMVDEVVPPAIPTTATTEAEVPVPSPAVLPPAQEAANEPPATPAPAQTRSRAARPAGQLSALDAAARVLAAAGQPLTCHQLIEAMAAQGLWFSPQGKTPAGMLYAAILREQAVKGAAARFVKAGRGQFAHRAQ